MLFASSPHHNLQRDRGIRVSRRHKTSVSMGKKFFLIFFFLFFSLSGKKRAFVFFSLNIFSSPPPPKNKEFTADNNRSNPSDTNNTCTEKSLSLFIRIRSVQSIDRYNYNIFNPNSMYFEYTTVYLY